MKGKKENQEKNPIDCTGLPGFTKDYYSVGWKAGLHDNRLRLYVSYMLIRWPTGQAETYANEWATRFLEGYEYQYSDKEGQEILKKLYLGGHKKVS